MSSVIENINFFSRAANYVFQIVFHIIEVLYEQQGLVVSLSVSL